MNRAGRAKVVLFLLGGLGLGVALGLLVIASGPGLAGGRQRSGPPAVGAPVPDFALEALRRGEKVRLSDLQGRPVVINFWATWCGPCKEEMPLFEAYAQKYGDRLVWLAVNEQEDAATVEQFLQEMGITLPVLLDSEGRAAQAYYVRGFPATFFVDEQGILRAQHLGQVDEALLSVYLETIGIRP